jgi:hypothetical protein
MLCLRLLVLLDNEDFLIKEDVLLMEDNKDEMLLRSPPGWNITEVTEEPWASKTAVGALNDLKS